MKILKKIWNFLLKAESAIMMTANIGVAILVFISVVIRYLLEKNTGGMEELIVIVAIWIYFMGGTYGSYENSHITADFLSIFVHSERGHRIITVVRNCISVLILFGASYCAMELLLYSIENPSATSILKIPMIVVYLPVFLGIFLMTFYTIVHCVESIRVLAGKAGAVGKERLEGEV